MNWNKVSDQLPHHARPVLVCFGPGNSNYLVATYEEGGWWSHETDEHIEDVFAWAEIRRPE